MGGLRRTLLLERGNQRGVVTGDGGDGKRGRGRGDGGRGREGGTLNPKHRHCKNCERIVAHEASAFYQLESNAATHHSWRKKEFHGIP